MESIIAAIITGGVMTFNGDKKELYFDAYKKWENKAIPVG